MSNSEIRTYERDFISDKISDYPHLTLVNNKKASGFPNDINKTQFDNFVLFKKACRDQKLIPNFNYYDDFYLLKFCRARKFELDKVLIMFKNFLNWRKKENIDNIDNIFVMKDLMKLKELYPHGYHKVDKLGRPIYIEILSKVKIDEVFKLISDENLIKYYVQEYERVMKYRFPACSKLKGTRIDQSFTVLDVKGIGLSHVFGKTKKFLQIATSIGQDYYPENMGVMFIINCGSFFGLLWNLVKGFLDPKTREKIKVEGSKYQTKLLEFIDSENLPTFLGGSCTCSHIEGGCLYSDIGPWNPEGGIPQQKYI